MTPADTRLYGERLAATRPRVERYVRSRGVADPEDVAQDVITEAVAKADSLSGLDDPRLESWLFTVAYRRVADTYRRRYRRPAHVTDDSVDLPSGHPGPEVEACRNETGQLVRDAMDRLEAREQFVIRLRLLEDIPAQAVADMLDTSASHVRVIQTRALAKLRSMLPPPAYLELRDRAGWALAWSIGIDTARRHAHRAATKVRPEAADGVGVVARLASAGTVVAVAVTTAIVVPQSVSAGVRTGDGTIDAVEAQALGQAPRPDEPPATRPVTVGNGPTTEPDVTSPPSTAVTALPDVVDPPVATTQPAVSPQPPGGETATTLPETGNVTAEVEVDDGDTGAQVQLGELADVEADVEIDDGVALEVGADVAGTVAVDATVEASPEGVAAGVEAVDTVEVDAGVSTEDGTAVEADAAGVDAEVAVDEDEGVQIEIGGISIGLGP